MSTDAIVLLKEDHKEMRRLFKAFQDAEEGPASKRQQLVRQILEALTVHTYLENEVMYPEVRKLVPDVEDDILESYEEHHVADVLCFELFTMAAEDERYNAKTTVLMENVLHHVQEEEEEWFPKVREALGRNQLQEIGARMIELRPKAPKTPTAPKALKKSLDAVTA
ncbi:hemerythrin domain-containing protein [Micromonospora sp. DR5-3]|uniref:hemerythrin domain-containing protein n=1 Tax=unclassified Micromonospora TaxID=2617518 RepID=UPI0011D782B3|nr:MULTISPECIES: hemerythrin domain-containing protein [unclassified Micromonospora]MCW3815188.1 hemerythrin domain-containing protein [Micromonospora sp. DR5-3]TYC22225.1 hemerythrin domain-containing protein [Micromonospora sp. MP36]